MTTRLEIKLGNLADLATEFLAIAKAIERGKQPRPRNRFYVDDLLTLQQILSPRRRRLLAYVSQCGPVSIRKAAVGLRRRYETVRHDVQRLHEIGLLEKRSRGLVLGLVVSTASSVPRPLQVLLEQGMARIKKGFSLSHNELWTKAAKK